MDLTFSARKKKRAFPDDDETFTTPKKSRLRSPTLTPRSLARPAPPKLPTHLSKLLNVQSALEHTIALALATAGASPSQDTGRLPNVINHVSLASSGHSITIELSDIKRLCWLWEWDGVTLPMKEEVNPFVEAVPVSKDWVRGGNGLVVSPTTYLVRSEAKRLPAYGLGIEVELDDGEGMGAVARWTLGGEVRRQHVNSKLLKWVELHPAAAVPEIPMADLPPLPKSSTNATSLRELVSRKPLLSPTKRSPTKPGDFAVPFPITPTSNARGVATPTSVPSTPSTSRTADPMTPSSQTGKEASTAPETPTSSRRAALYERIRQRSLSSSSTPAKGSALVTIKTPGSAQAKTKMVGPEEMRRRCLLGRLAGVADGVWMMFQGGAGSVGRKRRAMPAQEVVAAVVKSSPVPMSDSEAHESLIILTQLCPFFLQKLNVGGEEWLEMPASSSMTPSTLSEPTSPKRGPGLFGHLTGAAETLGTEVSPSGLVTGEDVFGSPPPPDSKGTKVTVRSLAKTLAPPTKLLTAPSPIKSSLKTPAKRRLPTSPLRAAGSPSKLSVPTSPLRAVLSPRKERAAEELLLRSPKRVKREEGGLREVRERIRRELERFEGED